MTGPSTPLLRPSDADLLAICARTRIPRWASHVAVRRDGSRAYPACWQDREQTYLDEDPSGLKVGEWACGFKAAYYRFFPVAEVRKARRP